MIIPSIDLEGGRTVQLVGGEELAIDAGDPRPIAERFGRVGEIAVIDLDAAKGMGSNADLVRDLLSRARCRVGGGIRDVESARAWLDTGAAKVILGTAACPEVLRHLPRERVIAAVDGRDGEIVVEGWRKRTGERVLDRVRQLRELVGGFLVTFVEREGRMEGIPMQVVRELKEACGDAELCVAGGVREARELAELDALGVDAQVGMALYRGDLDLAGTLFAILVSDRDDGLVPTVVCDELGVSLGLAWSSEDSLRVALESGRGAYQSRRRGLWIKGETSGATQDLLSVEMDCDRDALRFVVRQHGAGFCHLDTPTCFGEGKGPAVLERRIRTRLQQSVDGSYVQRLAKDEDLLHAKILEEAQELVDAKTREEVIHEAADLQFFLQTKIATSDVSMADVMRELERRTLRVTRRAGGKKETRRAETGGCDD